MRKVLFKAWIPIQYVEENGKHKQVKDTGCYQSEYLTKGVFHEWGVAFEEYEAGPGNYTIALIELEDGVICPVMPQHLKFVE